MKRRTLLRAALAVPLVSQSVSAAPVGRTGNDALFTGLSGLDYALGGIGPGELSCVLGPPCMGKTLLLLELAARISDRYRQNVIFYSAHKPSVYLAKKAGLRGDAHVVFAEESRHRSGNVDPGSDQAAIHFLDSNSADVDRACEIAGGLRNNHPAGCAVLILDGWSSYPERGTRFAVVDGIPHYPAERWPHVQMSRETLMNVKRFSVASAMPVFVGVTTASLLDDEALAASFGLETEVRMGADRLLSLYRPELYCCSAQVKPGDRNVVCLSGTRPQWWDTRCSGLRFDPRQLGFSTAA